MSRYQGSGPQTPSLKYMSLGQQAWPSPAQESPHAHNIDENLCLSERRHGAPQSHPDFLPNHDIDLSQRGSLSRRWN